MGQHDKHPIHDNGPDNFKIGEFCSLQARLELNQAAENKLRRLREKLEGELKEVEASEASLKAKLSETKAQLVEKDDQIVELKSQLRHIQTEMGQLKKVRILFISF